MTVTMLLNIFFRDIRPGILTFWTNFAIFMVDEGAEQSKQQTLYSLLK
jgi:hypothetical protein